ncbi:MAG: hypothetical protein AB1333_04300 [Patescibacteria group bacterium]
MIRKIFGFLMGTILGGFLSGVALVFIYLHEENKAAPFLGFSFWIALLVLFKPKKRKNGEPDLPALEVAGMSFFVSLLVFFLGYNLIRFLGFL